MIYKPGDIVEKTYKNLGISHIKYFLILEKTDLQGEYRIIDLGEDDIFNVRLEKETDIYKTKLIA